MDDVEAKLAKREQSLRIAWGILQRLRDVLKRYSKREIARAAGKNIEVEGLILLGEMENVFQDLKKRHIRGEEAMRHLRPFLGRKVRDWEKEWFVYWEEQLVRACVGMPLDTKPICRRMGAGDEGLEPLKCPPKPVDPEDANIQPL